MSEHKKNQRPSNLARHQKGIEAKKTQKETKALAGAKKKDSHATKDALRTTGSKSRMGKKK